MYNSKTLRLLALSAIPSLIVFFAVTLMPGCGEDTTTNTKTYIDNPNVKSFDSIGVEEHDSAFTARNGIDLLKGETTVDTGYNRDCSLADSASWGENFYLQNGTLDNPLLSGGYDSRWFRVYEDTSAATFDTLSKVWGKSLDTNDFTQSGTEFGGFFRYPLNSHPVFCFWLKGKSEINPKNIFGLLQPRESTDSLLGVPYGYKMSFRVRINTNGENDFRKRILQ